MTRSARLATSAKVSHAHKPIAMWIMQILTAPAVVASVFYGWKWTAIAARETPRGDGSAGIFVFSIFFGLFAWMLAISITAYLRRPIVRWFGGAFIVFIFLLIVFAAFFENFPDQTGPTFRLMRPVLGVAAMGLTCYWLYAFAFSAKAKRYLGLQ